MREFFEKYKLVLNGDANLTIPKEYIFNNRRILSLLISIATALCLFMFLFNRKTVITESLIGDSSLTELIAEKEITKISGYQTIEAKQELEGLAENNPINFAFYRVLPGESLSTVADKFGLSMATVLSLNSLDNAHSVRVGQKVLVSTRSGIIFNSKQDEKICKLTERYGISLAETLEVNEFQGEDIKAGQTLFLPGANYDRKMMAEVLGFKFLRPVTYFRRISSYFGYRRHPVYGRRKLHAGIDFAAPTGTPVVAAKEGRVIFSGNNGASGIQVKIRHDNGYITSYSHLSKTRTQNGAWVKAGDRIGDIGSTGISTGPHLHFEIRRYGKALNPLYHGLQIR